VTTDDVETLVRRLLAAGMGVLVLLAPTTGAAPTSDPPAVTVRPGPAGAGSGAGTGTDDRTRDAGEATSAAAVLGWGAPTHVDEFRDGLSPDWRVYDGPGHGGEGRRSPGAVSVEDGVMTITGDRAGTTAGMAWDTGQRYGRWEGRVRAPAAADSYHALMLLWPDAEDWPVGGEVDFMEMLDGDRRSTNLFLHHGADNEQVAGEVATDATRWHNWAVEWTPRAITAYLDGKQWFRSTDPRTQPPGPMHLCIQLDWFPGDGATRTSTMQVDWVKQYALDGSAASGKPGPGKDAPSAAGPAGGGYRTAALGTRAGGGWRWERRSGGAASGGVPSPSGSRTGRAGVGDATGPGGPGR
jgi:glycosyl hydrolase family 16